MRIQYANEKPFLQQLLWLKLAPTVHNKTEPEFEVTQISLSFEAT